MSLAVLDVARRAACLKGVCTLAMVTPPADQGVSAEAIAWFRDYAGKIEGLGLGPHLTPVERAFVDRGADDMDPFMQIQLTWRVEAYQALLWSLGLVPDLPPYGQMADQRILELPAREVLAATELRDTGEAREIAELWHWRSRTRRLFPADLELPRSTAASLHEQGLLDDLVDGDFAVDGVAYHALPDDAWARVRSITMERHHALNWLEGYAPGDRWEETPTDT